MKGRMAKQCGILWWFFIGASFLGISLLTVFRDESCLPSSSLQEFRVL